MPLFFYFIRKEACLQFVYSCVCRAYGLIASCTHNFYLHPCHPDACRRLFYFSSGISDAEIKSSGFLKSVMPPEQIPHMQSGQNPSQS